MTSDISCRYRSRRIGAAASVLTVIAVAAVLAVAWQAHVPQAWWPHTGHAFTANPSPVHQDPCNRIWGPAKTYCEHGNTAWAKDHHDDSNGGEWRLATAGAGLAALVVWRCSAAAWRRR